MRTSRNVVAGLTTLLVSGMLVACGDAGRGPTGPAPGGPLFAAVAFTSAERVPVEVIVPTCEGVPVTLTGYFVIVTHVTLDDAGGVHIKTHVNPAELSGEINGVTYHGTGVTQEELNVNGVLPVTYTVTNNFRIIAEGTTDNYLVHNNVHITINANGTTTAFVDNFQFDCQG